MQFFSAGKSDAVPRSFCYMQVAASQILGIAIIISTPYHWDTQ
jgi:hypothetical protein